MTVILLIFCAWVLGFVMALMLPDSKPKPAPLGEIEFIEIIDTHRGEIIRHDRRTGKTWAFAKYGWIPISEPDPPA